ncbi:MAG: xanthine dehydrogenase family protein subunit M [Nitrospinota bacterium]|nr:xanthine dehydrogenase family protein subunit M [Nitrospinota bacterium]
MGVPRFELLEPVTYEEASRLISAHETIPLAGGTAIISMMRQRLFNPSHIVSLHKISGLGGVSPAKSGGLSIGAMATLRSVEMHPAVRSQYPLLSETLSSVANVRVRWSATVGGNLAHGDYRLDPPGALIALGARVRLGSARGERELQLEDFFRGFFETAKEDDEIILGVDLPPTDEEASGHYLKFTSHASADWPCVGVAVYIKENFSGKCESARVVLTAAAQTPLLLEGVNEILSGEAVTEAAAQKVADLTHSQLDPIEDSSGSTWYKREIAPVLVRRALLEAARRKPKARDERRKN